MNVIYNRSKTEHKKSFNPSGFYSGEYTSTQTGYVRNTDGLELKELRRHPNQITKSKTARYLVDRTNGGRYVSSIWGAEFEYQKIRYVINTTGPDSVKISVVRQAYKKGSKK